MKTTPSRKPLVLVALGVVLVATAAWQGNRLAGKGAPPAPLTTPASNSAVHIRAEGRVVCYPGAQVEVGSEMAGLIARLPVEENHPVEKGAVIAGLKSDELQASLAEARARVTEFEAEQDLAEHDLDRNRRLLDTGTLSRQEFERTSRDLAVIQARRASAIATVARLQAALAKTIITAPISGVLLRRHVQPGETIEANTSLATLADLERVRIEAEVDEYDASRVRLGQRVTITAEGSPGQAWSGMVEEVPSVVVDKGLQPRDPSRPTDVRVLLVKIALAARTPIKLGQRVEVEIADE